MERIQRANEYGKKLSNLIEEENYNKNLQETELREAKILEQMIANYGEENGRELYQKHLQKFEDKMSKKYGV